MVGKMAMGWVEDLNSGQWNDGGAGCIAFVVVVALIVAVQALRERWRRTSAPPSGRARGRPG